MGCLFDTTVLSEEEFLMKGSIRKRGSKWSYRVELGRENGKRAQIERGGFKTKK